MKTKLLAVVLMCSILTGCATGKNSRAHSLETYLPGIRDLLQGFVDSQSPNEVDYFYVSPVSRQDAGEFAYAYWMTGNSIIILDLPVGKLQDPIGYLWYAGKARIDLAKDVVPTDNDVGGSTYLVDAAWVEGILRDCLVAGVRVVVRKNRLTSGWRQ
jgi:hypothetical protein